MKSRLLLFLALSVHSATGGFKPSIDTRGGGPPRAPAPARTCDAGEAPLRLRGGAASCEPASLVERAKTWHPVLLALLGTSFGWFMTALGSAAVIINMLGLKEEQYRRVLDFMLGVSGGVMTAASYWSLLAPALEFAEDQGWGAHSYAPVALGFLSGGVLLQATDRLLHRLQARNSAQFCGAAIIAREPTLCHNPLLHRLRRPPQGPLEELDLYKGVVADNTIASPSKTPASPGRRTASPAKRRPAAGGGVMTRPGETKERRSQRLRRLMLLIIAITLHNFPEGMAVGDAAAAAAGLSHAHSPSPLLPSSRQASASARSAQRAAPPSAAPSRSPSASASKTSRRAWRCRCR